MKHLSNTNELSTQKEVLRNTSCVAATAVDKMQLGLADGQTRIVTDTRHTVRTVRKKFIILTKIVNINNSVAKCL